MQVQRIGFYNQFSINKNQQKQTKNPIGFGMMLDISKQEKAIKELVGTDGFAKVKAFVDDLNIPEKMKELFSDCYKEFYPNETFDPKMCEGFDEALPGLELQENSSDLTKCLTVYVLEKGIKDYMGVGHRCISTPIFAESLIEEIKFAFKNFAEDRIISDTRDKLLTTFTNNLNELRAEFSEILS